MMTGACSTLSTHWLIGSEVGEVYWVCRDHDQCLVNGGGQDHCILAHGQGDVLGHELLVPYEHGGVQGDVLAQDD